VTGTTVPLLLSGPVEGETEVMAGCCSTVKLTLLLLTPLTTTVTGPLVALLGTCAIVLVALN
jgi:methylglyoxal synthase